MNSRTEEEDDDDEDSDSKNSRKRDRFKSERAIISLSKPNKKNIPDSLDDVKVTSSNSATQSKGSNKKKGSVHSRLNGAPVPVAQVPPPAGIRGPGPVSIHQSYFIYKSF